MSVIQKIQYWYRWIFQPHYFAGEKAEEHFEQLCGTKGYILEKIPQDKRNFAKYAAQTQRSIKRGDYLVRNLKNLEIEVKCYTTLNYGGKDYYFIKYSHIKRHEEMANLTGEPIVFAIFQRNGREVVENSLRMIPLTELTPPSRRSSAIVYSQRFKCLCVPTTIMYPDFNYLEWYKSEIGKANFSNSSPYQTEVVKKTYN